MNACLTLTRPAKLAYFILLMLSAPSEKPQFLLAAPSSGSGKTTLTLGLLRALARRGLMVQPFKCGPDYLDTHHHTQAAGRPSLNLDLFMASVGHAQATYAQYTTPADVAVVEGVMGLFDGADRMRGSAADVAEQLGIPVILVVNAKAMAYSVAPLLFGFKNFYPGIRLVGAIFNFVNTASHYHFLREACEDVGVEPLGYLPSNPNFVIPSRHLGLSIDTTIQYEAIVEALADALPRTVDLDRLLAVTCTAAPIATPRPPVVVGATPNRRIAVARDAAFTFTYYQNLQALDQLGEVTYFSPLADEALPAGTDFLYLPGGYPELFAEVLSANVPMRTSIAAYCAGGGATYAECGGLMYLGQHLLDAQGQRFAMAGVLPCATSMVAAKLTLGYRSVAWNNLTIKGHEFHYSSLTDHGLTPVPAIITNAKRMEVPAPLYRQGNVWASYVHLYWGENPAFIKALLTASAPVAEPE
jgi:cobyrinic acid a,c-diamide synthase